MSELRADTVGELLEARLAQSPGALACSERAGQGWAPRTWAEVGTRLEAVRAQLARLGVGPGGTVALMAPNQLAWDLVQWAALQLGAQVVGLDAADRPENLAEVLAQTRPGLVAVADVAALTVLGGLAPSVPVLTLAERAPRRPDGGPAEPLALALGAASPAPPVRVSPTALATTVFTSGTTGRPKGIAYTHRQLCLAVRGILEGLPELVDGDRVPCWMPQALLFQRIINLCAVARGAHVFYVDKPLELASLLPGIAPHLLVGVPRFFEKAWTGISERIDARPPPVRALARWALGVGRRWAALSREGRAPGALLRAQHRVADRLVLSAIRQAFGGQLRYLVSGAAPLPVWLLESLHGAGLLVLEAYGLSECIVPVCMNTPRAFRFGTVGRPLALNEVRLSEDGEVQVRGEGVFTGYQGSSTRPLDADGWLSTGDLGALDADGYLSLVGRKSEVVKSSTGRKVPLPAIEAQLRRLSWVELPMVVALGRPAPVAVLFVSVPRLGGGEPEPLLRQALERLRQDVRQVSEALAAHHRPAGVVLVARPPRLDLGELTLSLKVRRAVIEAALAPALTALTAQVEARDPAPQWLGELQALVATT